MDFNLDYAPGDMLNVALHRLPLRAHLDETVTKSTVIVIQLDTISMTHKVLEHRLKESSVWPSFTPVIAGDFLSLRYANTTYVLDWRLERDLFICISEDLYSLLYSIVHQTLIYFSSFLLGGLRYHKFHSLPLSALGQTWSKGPVRVEASTFTLPKSTPDELILEPCLGHMRRPKYSIIKPSWDTGQLTRVAFYVGGPPDRRNQYKFYLLTSTTPQPSSREHVGPFTVTRTVDVEYPGSISLSDFWFTRMGTAAFLTTIDGIENMYAVRFPDSEDHGHDGREFGARPVSMILRVEKFTYRTMSPLKVWDVDPYSGALVFVEGGSFGVWHFA